jgi:hypothetical protein
MHACQVIVLEQLQGQLEALKEGQQRHISLQSNVQPW